MFRTNIQEEFEVAAEDFIAFSRKVALAPCASTWLALNILTNR